MKIENPKKVKHTYTQKIFSSPEKVFPLLCPVREADWVDGWDPEIVYSGSGFAEQDCIFITSSDGVNELAKYDLNGKSVYFTERVSKNAGQIQITTEDPVNKEEDNTVLGILASIGSDILSEDSKSTLQNSVDTKILAGYVSDGLKNALKLYLNTAAVESPDDNPDYITETVLEECSLVVKESGVSVYVLANARIIDRTSGNLVWENSEAQTIPIEQNSADKNSSKTIVKVFNALQLASLSEEELNRVVGTAADDVGAYMAETFREDLAESRKTK